MLYSHSLTHSPQNLKSNTEYSSQRWTSFNSCYRQ